MDNTQKYETIIRLNTEQAKEEIDKLQAKIDDLKRKRQEALSAGDTKTWKKLGKEIEKDTAKLDAMKSRVKSIESTLDNMSAAGPKQLKDTIRDINALLNSGSIERGSAQWKELTAALREANTELAKIKNESKATEPALTRIVGFFNKNWGVITQALGAVTGLTMTMRKAVQEYATMEEEMANVRKYTGMTTEGVADLNEELKKMDTRTAREQLNQLAGAAGRLGITSKEGVLEFVDAADKIQVALGDDLGEGAVDQIGKLAMAFGEDERMGLRGAMLATGSAVNELAQNSSAKAGFLVDFTARVAGFGKQLGLTQAQIMGFGAVMDENLLRDEMAATAFGNMLTKMQTDTEKFARIAGMSVKEFTRLLNEDANQAILNLADSLRSQDPQTMMKMLDDMGLDGARAVGVLSTMADKINDVRDRQKLANEAYKEGTSVVNEFGVMNNTVQARLEKCKKRFHEMTIELGEQLLPVVKYTCTGFSLLVKGLSTVTKFAGEHKTEIAAVSVAIATYTAYVKSATIATKVYTAVTKLAQIATKGFNAATKLNPVGLLISALSAAVVLFIKYRDRINGANEAISMLRQAGSKLAGVLAQVTGWMLSLVKKAVLLYDKFSFVRKIIQLLVTSFTTGFTTITIAVNLLIDELGAVANIIEGIFTMDWDKIKSGYKQGFKAIADAAVAEFKNVKRAVKDTLSAPPPAGSGQKVIETAEGTAKQKDKETVVVEPKDKVDYHSPEDEKKREKEQREQEKHLKEQNRQLKEATNQRMAEEALSYSLGLTNYRDYIEKRKQIQLDGIRQRKALFTEGSAEYLRLDAEEKKLLAHGDEEARKFTLKEKEREHRQKMALLEANFHDENSAIYHNQEALNEALFQEEMDFLQWKKDQAVKGSLEEMELEWEIQDRNNEHQMNREREYREKLSQYREAMGKTDYQQLQEIELKGIETIYGALLQAGMMTKKEYDAIVEHIKRKYAELQAEQETGNEVQALASKSLETARKKAGVKKQGAGNDAATGIYSISAAVQNQHAINEQLKQLYGEDYKNNKEYQEAKRQLDMETMQTIVAGAQSAYQTINSFMSAASSYAQACSELEVAKITADYDKQIAAAGKNSKMKEQLEKERDKKVAAAKTKANKKAMVMEMAQAVAQTAMGAISAYSSTMAGAPYPANLILAPISAGIALAAGAFQIAAIKKQHQVEEAGYYEGGFTGGRRYRKEAGVVHEGEFVANHKAVQNPAILPFLSFLDQAQRNNTVGSLKMEELYSSMGASGNSQVVAPVVNVQTNNEELLGILELVRETQDRLATQLELGIGVDVPISGEEGVYSRIKRYENLLKNK